MKISQKWLKTYEIYKQVYGYSYSKEDQEQMYFFESRGLKAYIDKYGEKLPTLRGAKEALDLLTTEVLDIVKHSLTSDNWFFLYKDWEFLGIKLTRPILEHILKEKALTDYQIEVQEIIWKWNQKIEIIKTCDSFQKFQDRVWLDDVDEMLVLNLDNKCWKEVNDFAKQHYEEVERELEWRNARDVNAQRRSHELHRANRKKIL